MNNYQTVYPQINTNYPIEQTNVNSVTTTQTPVNTPGNSQNANTLERTPEQDQFKSAKEISQYCATSIKPKDVQNGLVTATGILIAFKALAEAGFDVWDMFSSKFQPQSKEEEETLKAFLAPAKPQGQNINQSV